MAVLVLVVSGCGSSEQPSVSSSDRPVTRTAHDGTLTVSFRAEPGRAGEGEPVGLVLHAEQPAAPGALAYQIDFGDGTTDQNVVAQVCRGGPTETARETWRFSHRYPRAGTYTVVATVSAGCTPNRAVAEIPVEIRGT